MAKYVCIMLIRFYQKAISPFLPHACRFYPSCSHYSAMAIQELGVVRGAIKSVKRVLRCHPFSPGGVDFVEVK